MLLACIQHPSHQSVWLTIAPVPPARMHRDHLDGDHDAYGDRDHLDGDAYGDHAARCNGATTYTLVIL